MRVAVLNESGLLIDVVDDDKPGPSAIDAGDLPGGGKYFYRDGEFIPVGFGKGKPQAPRVSRDNAMYHALRALMNGAPLPQECRDWCDWYEATYK